MCGLPGERCTCICHEPGMTVFHCMPCCGQCPHCGDNISFHALDEHTERCKKEREELGLPLNAYDFLEMLPEQILEEIKKEREE